MAGTIIVDRIESDASYTSTINVANRITFSNTVNFGVFAGTAPVAGFYLPTTNNLAFTTASTERMRIDSSGNVGIGTSSPTGKLNVVTNNSHDGGATFDSTGTTQVWMRDTDATVNTRNWGLQISGGDFNILRANDDRATGFVTPVSFGQAPANSLLINSAGLITILGQIKFPATQNASADANTLDDYEEGTYTPTFTSMTVNSGSAVYSGKYTKIGNLCYAMFGTSGTQNVTAVQGVTQFSLPFVSSGVNFSAGLGSGPGLAQNGNTTATSGLQGPTNGASGGYFIQGLAATSSIVGAITYQTA